MYLNVFGTFFVGFYFENWELAFCFGAGSSALFVFLALNRSTNAEDGGGTSTTANKSDSNKN